MADIELFVDSISFDLPCNLVYKKLCFQSVLKSIGCEIEDCHESISERILDYMNLIREFDGDKLFVIVNYRSLFNDRETELLMESIHMHKYKAIMIDGSAQEKLIWEDRCTIDDDLCIF